MERNQFTKPAPETNADLGRLSSLIEFLIDHLEDAHEHLILAETSIDLEWTRDTLGECRMRLSEALLEARYRLEQSPKRLTEPK